MRNSMLFSTLLVFFPAYNSKQVYGQSWLMAGNYPVHAFTHSDNEYPRTPGQICQGRSIAGKYIIPYRGYDPAISSQAVQHPDRLPAHLAKVPGEIIHIEIYMLLHDLRIH